MKINEIIKHLEQYAPLQLQEDYDNSGLITGDKNWETSSALVCLDCTEEVVDEAINRGEKKTKRRSGKIRNLTTDQLQNDENLVNSQPSPFFGQQSVGARAYLLHQKLRRQTASIRDKRANNHS